MFSQSSVTGISVTLEPAVSLRSDLSYLQSVTRVTISSWQAVHIDSVCSASRTYFDELHTDSQTIRTHFCCSSVTGMIISTASHPVFHC